MISDSTYEALQSTCDFGSSMHPSEECVNAFDVADLELGNIDPYSIFTPVCTATTSRKRLMRGRYVSTHELYKLVLLNENRSIYDP